MNIYTPARGFCQIVALLAAICAGPAFAQSGPSLRPDAAGWIELFDGHSLAGWRSPVSTQPPPDWGVQDGAIVLHHTGPYFDLVTDGSYGNFELEFEWRISKGGNSGVIYHVNDDVSDRSWKSGFEYQILDNAHGEAPVEQAASLFDLYPPSEDATKPVGAWNQARILVRGPLIEHWLNGKLVVRCRRDSADFTRRLAASKFAAFPGFGSFPAGRIALQDHGDDVAFRNLRLRQLDTLTSSPVP